MDEEKNVGTNHGACRWWRRVIATAYSFESGPRPVSDNGTSSTLGLRENVSRFEIWPYEN